MGNKAFVGVVLLLWASTMTWLVSAKILPSFFRGEPPRSSTLSQLEPVAWRIELQGTHCGTAVSQAVDGGLGTLEVHSIVKLRDLPLPKVAPVWMQTMLKNLGEVELSLRNQATLDTLGALTTFQTRVRVNGGEPVIKMTGRVNDGLLHLKIHSGEYVRTSQHPWNSKSMVGGTLSPNPKLIQVWPGRKWREEIYSPFGQPGSPSELVEAEVIEEDFIRYNNKMTRTKRIEYRSVTSAGVSADDRLRAKLWVDDGGNVLRQDTYFMNVRLQFTRMDEISSERLADAMLELDRHAATLVPQLETSTQSTDRPGEPESGLTPQQGRAGREPAGHYD